MSCLGPCHLAERDPRPCKSSNSSARLGMMRASLLSLTVLIVQAGTAISAPARFRAGELLVAVADPRVIVLERGGRVSSSDAAVRSALERHGLSRFAALEKGRGGEADRFLRLKSDRSDF